MMCRQRNCTAPTAGGPDGGSRYCQRHLDERWLCEHGLRNADSFNDLRDWLQEYVLRDAQENIK